MEAPFHGRGPHHVLRQPVTTEVGENVSSWAIAFSDFGAPAATVKLKIVELGGKVGSARRRGPEGRPLSEK